jgi:flagellar hook-length control protein FliK
LENTEKEIMSSNAFMLPALPQTPAPGLNAIDSKAPAAFKSDRLGESTDQSRSFSTTLNRISERNERSNSKSTPAENRAVTSGGEDTDSVNPEKMSKTSASARDDIEESAAPVSPVSEESSPSIHALQAFGWMHYNFIPFSMADDGSLTIEPPSDSTTGSSLSMLTEWIAHLQAQGQQDQSEQVGIGPFEQLQANISPEATNPDQFFRLWHWMATLPAQEGALNGQTESFGPNVNAPLNHLLHMLGMTGAAWDLNPDTSSSGGPKMAAGMETAHLNEDLLLKMTTASQSAETGLSENPKMAAAGHDGRLALRASGDSNSETLLEAQARQMSENSQPSKIQAALKAAAEQPAHPNSAAEAITAKTPEEALGIKSAVLKSEILPLDAPGNKIIQIDGDSKDSGFAFSQDQMPQHLARLENAAQSSEAAQRGLTPQTLNQIVQKAVLSLNNGQHEVQIDLKPDYLGHIRMQIVSEGQQVAVRIVAELPFVKDMLENNLHQLKAELQAQGLKVDELEVSVADDSRADDDKHQEAAEVLRARALKNSRLSVDAAAEEQADMHTGPGDGIAESAIDYFA